MPRFDPAEFGRLLARLTPQELRQAEGLVAEARQPSDRWLAMYASQASRCACRLLNSCSSPSSEDLRV